MPLAGVALRFNFNLTAVVFELLEAAGLWFFLEAVTTTGLTTAVFAFSFGLGFEFVAGLAFARTGLVALFEGALPFAGAVVVVFLVFVLLFATVLSRRTPGEPGCYSPEN